MSNLPPPPSHGSDDLPPAPGYWKASDGNWYPPETYPQAQAAAGTVAAQQTEPDAPEPPWWKRWWVIAGAAVVVLLVVGVLLGGGNDDGGNNGPDGDDVAEVDQSETAQTTRAPTTEAPSTGEAETPDDEEAADVQGCSIVDDDTLQIELVNTSLETSSYSIAAVYRDDAGQRVGDDNPFINNVRPGERVVEEVFAFGPQGSTCEIGDVERFSTASEPDQLDDVDSCEITGRDFADDLTAEVVVTNDSSQTSNYSITVAFVRDDGVRIGTGSAFIPAVVSGESAPTDVFSIVDGDASVCEVAFVLRTAA